MQTFLPYKDFERSAGVLDDRRLNKQRIEAKQIYLSLTDPLYGWKHHPAVKQWINYEDALVEYGLTMCMEWTNRGRNDDADLYGWFRVLYPDRPLGLFVRPWWLGRDELHSSHRSNLLRKDPVHYGKFGWTEPPDIPYWWPSKEVGL